eukprot:6404810-Heterocapsa_arctica.AAC.1
MLADKLSAKDVPSHRGSAAEDPPPDPGHAQVAQDWLNSGPNRHQSGLIRGVDYVVARAAADARIAPESPFGRFLSGILRACTPDMTRQLPYVLCMSLLQTLQQSKTNAKHSAANGWLSTTLPMPMHCACAIADDLNGGAAAVIQ